MVDEQRVADLLVAAEAYLADVRRFVAAVDRATFLEDVGEQYRIAFPLQQAVQRCTDIAAHWLADGPGPRPESAAGLFSALADRGALDRQLADRLAAMARFRNLLVHQYADVDPARVWTILHEDLDDVADFLGVVARALGDG